jgi:hypothetical protein
MATQIRQLASLNGDACYINAQYDDTNMVATRILWANAMTVPVRVWVFKQDGTVLIADQVIAPNTPEQSRNLAGPNRFNVDTEYPSINLSS